VKPSNHFQLSGWLSLRWTGLRK